MAVVTMTLFRRTVAWSNQSLDRERWLPREISAPCHIKSGTLRWPGDMTRGTGILWAGGNPDMTGCLECSLTRPVLAYFKAYLAQSWSQTFAISDSLSIFCWRNFREIVNSKLIFR